MGVIISGNKSVYNLSKTKIEPFNETLSSGAALAPCMQV